MKQVGTFERLFRLAACLGALTMGERSASAVTVNFSGQIHASCSISGFEPEGLAMVPAAHRETAIGYIQVSSIGKPSLAIHRVVAIGASGARDVVPVHMIALRAEGRRQESTLRGGIPHLSLDRRFERVAVSIAPQASEGLKRGAYRFEISALCAD